MKRYIFMFSLISYQLKNNEKINNETLDGYNAATYEEMSKI